MSKTIFFDLGGVLLLEAESNLHKAQNPNLQCVLAGQPPRIRIFNRVFEFVSLSTGKQSKTDWILGNISGKEIVEHIKAHIDKPEHAHFFKDEYEKNLIKHGTEYILVPELLVELTDIVLEGVTFIKKCKTLGIKIAVISNWDPKSFILIKKKQPDFFSLFDQESLIIPQQIGKTKPTVEIYEYALQKLNVNAQECIFIDDSLANVQGAQKCVISSIHHINWAETYKALTALNV